MVVVDLFIFFKNLIGLRDQLDLHYIIINLLVMVWVLSLSFNQRGRRRPQRLTVSLILNH